VVATGLKAKLEGIGFGIFIPTFFVVSGVTLDLDALFSSFETMVLVPLTVIALLLIRGVPVVLYRRFMSRREMAAAGLLQATSLSFIVPATQIGVELDKISTATAAGLVAAGVVTVLTFPVIALRFMDERRPA
jgi:Kef-type K+ transport system membrane component KefB